MSEDIPDDVFELLTRRAPPWTPFDQLVQARQDAQAWSWAQEDEEHAARWRAIMTANPHPGPGGWRLQ